MYPSSNINFNQNSQFFGGQINHHNIPENNNPNISKLDDFSSSNSLLHLSSPFMQYEDAAYELTWQQLHDLLFQQQQQQQPPMTTIATTTTTDDEDHSMGEVIKLDFDEKSFTGSRKRTSEKDRHSKILTANGFRDRRMRLSIPVARKFFALQDLLGFDKASKTIEWLMIQSSSAIKERRGLQQQEQVNSINSTPELEAISGIEESINNEIPQENISKKVKKTSSFNEGKAAVRLNPGSRSSCDPLTVKESRNIAREKARKRTMEKRKLGDESKESLAS